jgi:hypothetical protein
MLRRVLGKVRLVKGFIYCIDLAAMEVTPSGIETLPRQEECPVTL